MAEVPCDVVTVTSTMPTLPAGEVAVICVSELTVKLVALVLPNFTELAPVNAVPVMVTDVPPEVLPEVGFSLVMEGGGIV
jgi:hypothetical protein